MENVKNEETELLKPTRITKMFAKLTHRYLRILQTAGLDADDIGELIYLHEVEDKMSFDVPDELTKNPTAVLDWYRMTALKGALFLAKQKKEMERMEKKGYYLNELDKDEIRELLFGLHAANYLSGVHGLFLES